MSSSVGVNQNVMTSRGKSLIVQLNNAFSNGFFVRAVNYSPNDGGKKRSASSKTLVPTNIAKRLTTSPKPDEINTEKDTRRTMYIPSISIAGTPIEIWSTLNHDPVAKAIYASDEDRGISNTLSSFIVTCINGNTFTQIDPASGQQVTIHGSINVNNIGNLDNLIAVGFQYLDSNGNVLYRSNDPNNHRYDRLSFITIRHYLEEITKLYKEKKEQKAKEESFKYKASVNDIDAILNALGMGNTNVVSKSGGRTNSAHGLALKILNEAKNGCYLNVTKLSLEKYTGSTKKKDLPTGKGNSQVLLLSSSNGAREYLKEKQGYLCVYATYDPSSSPSLESARRVLVHVMTHCFLSKVEAGVNSSDVGYPLINQQQAEIIVSELINNVNNRNSVLPSSLPNPHFPFSTQMPGSLNPPLQPSFNSSSLALPSSQIMSNVPLPPAQFSLPSMQQQQQRPTSPRLQQSSALPNFTASTGIPNFSIPLSTPQVPPFSGGNGVASF